MTGLGTVLVRVALVFAGLIVATALVIVLLLAIGFRVPLDALRGPMEVAASQALGRAVSIDGGIELVPAFAPTFQIEGLRIADSPASPERDFLRADLARVQLRALPLLLARIHIAELAGEGLSLHLRRGTGGEINWSFAGAAAREPEEEPKPDGASALDDFLDAFVERIEIVGLDELLLRRIAVSYRNELLQSELDFELEESTGVLLAREPLRLTARGSLQGEEYSASLEGDAPVDLVTEGQPWTLGIRLEMAQTLLELRGRVEGDPLEARFWDLNEVVDGALVAEISLKGERLSDLAPIFGVSLPPLGPYRVGGTLESGGNRSSIRELVIGVGSSELRGELRAEYAKGVRPTMDVKLAVEDLQLDDFDFGDWSPFASEVAQGAEETKGAEEADVAEVEPIEIPPLLSRAVMGRLDAKLGIDVTSVHSGAERLGGAHLEALLEKGRFELSSLKLEVPGGAFDLSLAYEPTADGIDGEIRAKVDRLDYGVLARRADLETDMAGDISLDVGLRSRAPSVETLMANASGYFDFAIWPEGFESGIFDLWAVNLMSAVLPAVEGGKTSEIHCIVGLFDLVEGQMEQKGIAVDTTRMRVSGKAKVDFRDETVDLSLAPRPKKPEFFSAATPIHVKGSFSDFDVGVRPEDLVGTVIRFVTSVVVVPLQRMLETGRLGSEEGCSEALEAADRPKAF